MSKSGRAVAAVQDEPGSELKEVVFYAWTDAGTQSMPSSLRMRITGGQRVKDDSSGKIISLGYVEVQFNKGLLRISDPEVIREVRKMMERGDTITEDCEKYLAMVEPAERRTERMASKATQLAQEIEEADAEILRLKEQLAAKG